MRFIALKGGYRGVVYFSPDEDGWNFEVISPAAIEDARRDLESGGTRAKAAEVYAHALATACYAVAGPVPRAQALNALATFEPPASMRRTR